jgi:hypothetical protein
MASYSMDIYFSSHMVGTAPERYTQVIGTEMFIGNSSNGVVCARGRYLRRRILGICVPLSRAVCDDSLRLLRRNVSQFTARFFSSTDYHTVIRHLQTTSFHSISSSQYPFSSLIIIFDSSRHSIHLILKHSLLFI